MKITRRQLAGALAAGAVRTAAQTPEEPRKTPADRISQNVSALAKVKIPMAVEPAFLFKAQ